MQVLTFRQLRHQGLVIQVLKFHQLCHQGLLLKSLLPLCGVYLWKRLKSPEMRLNSCKSFLTAHYKILKWHMLHIYAWLGSCFIASTHIWARKYLLNLKIPALTITVLSNFNNFRSCYRGSLKMNLLRRVSGRKYMLKRENRSPNYCMFQSCKVNLILDPYILKIFRSVFGILGLKTWNTAITLKSVFLLHIMYEISALHVPR